MEREFSFNQLSGEFVVKNRKPGGIINSQTLLDNPIALIFEARDRREGNRGPPILKNKKSNAPPLPNFFLMLMT